MPKKALSDDAQEALGKFEDTVSSHNDFISKVRNNYRAYVGLMEKGSDADSWQSKRHPPYVRSIVETTIASLIDGKLRFEVKPKPKFYNSVEESNLAKEGAEANEILLTQQLEQDHFHEKMRPFVLQQAIAGVTVAKTLWRSESRRKKYLQVVDVGQQEFGLSPGYLLDYQEAERVERVYDGPCTEVVNVEDFFWHEGAIDIQRSPVVAHRVYMTYEELKQSPEYDNVSQLSKGSAQGSDGSSAFDLDSRQRTKDMIEVLEIWWKTEDGIKTCTLGNRQVELKAPRDNPFWHGEYPFVVCSTQPDLFKVNGFSQVGKVAHIQDAIWDMLNQTHDNVALMNNFIVGVNTQLVQDPDAIEIAPGEKLETDGPINEAIQQFVPNNVVGQLALPHIGMLQNDMQNLAATQPFTTTSEASRQGADTATEAALVSNIAQASAKQMQMQLNYAYQRIGQQRMELNQQFIRRPILVEVVGLDQESEQREIAPQILQGSYQFSITPMTESLMRSERRAEANAMLQLAMQIAPIMLPLAQAGAATPMNMDAFVEHWLKQYVDDPRQFFSEKPQPPAPQQPGAPQQPQQGQQPPPMNGGGMTAPEAVNPVNSPSNAGSISPAVMLQRMGAMRGGVNNV